MATLTQSQIYAVAVITGLPQPKVMAAIAMAESSGRTDVVNSIGCVGLWQINQPVHVKAHPTWTKEWLKNPINNAIAAKEIYKSQGFQAWEVYTNGMYAKFLGKSITATPSASTASYTGYVTPTGEKVDLRAKAEAAGWSWDDALRVFPPYELWKFLQGDPLPGDTEDMIPGGEALSDAGAALGDIASFTAKAGNWLSDASNWIRVAYVAGGMALVIGGLTVIARPLITSVATSGLGSAVKQFSKGK